MQLLRDNLTLWTSSDGGEAEPGREGEGAKEERTGDAPKPEESTPAAAAAPEPSNEAPAATES